MSFCGYLLHFLYVSQDYPSVGQLARVLAANNIQLIFAVTEDSVAAYKVRTDRRGCL